MSLGNKMFNGMAWSAIERISIQAIQFVLGIILARILTPKEYGIIGILLVFIVVSQVFIDSGFTKALIQKQDRTENDISTVFFFNIIISIVCYIIIWILAPFVAQFYEIESLSILLRVLALSLISNALFTVPATLYTIELDFKTLTKINLIATLLSGGVAIYLAYSGYGVWSLVFQTIIKSFSTLIFMWFFLRWKPKWLFSKSSIKSLFSFGSKLLASSLLNVIVNNFYSLFIAKFISAKDLGYYTRGTQFSDVIFSTVNAIFDRVLLPGLSSVQNQHDILIKHTRTIIRATALFVIPLFLFIAVMSKPIVVYLLTDKWILAVPILQIFCVARLITIISGINVNLLYTIGRTDLALRQQYLKIIVRVVFFIVALNYGIVFIALAELASTAVHFFINTYYPGKIMKYGPLNQLKDLSTIIISSIIMVISVFIITFYLDNDLIKLLVAPIVAGSIYYFLIKLFKIKELDLIKVKAKGFLNKK